MSWEQQRSSPASEILLLLLVAHLFFFFPKTDKYWGVGVFHQNLATTNTQVSSSSAEMFVTILWFVAQTQLTIKGCHLQECESADLFHIIKIIHYRRGLTVVLIMPIRPLYMVHKTPASFNCWVCFAGQPISHTNNSHFLHLSLYFDLLPWCFWTSFWKQQMTAAISSVAGSDLSQNNPGTTIFQQLKCF